MANQKYTSVIVKSSKKKNFNFLILIRALTLIFNFSLHNLVIFIN